MTSISPVATVSTLPFQVSPADTANNVSISNAVTSSSTSSTDSPSSSTAPATSAQQPDQTNTPVSNQVYNAVALTGASTIRGGNVNTLA